MRGQVDDPPPHPPLKRQQIQAMVLIFLPTCESRKQYQSQCASKNKHKEETKGRCKDLQYIKMAPTYRGVRPILMGSMIPGEVRRDYWNKYRDTKQSGTGINDTKQS